MMTFFMREAITPVYCSHIMRSMWAIALSKEFAERIAYVIRRPQIVFNIHSSEFQE